MLKSDGAKFIKECYDLPLEKITPKTIRNFSFKIVESGLEGLPVQPFGRHVVSGLRRGLRFGQGEQDVAGGSGLGVGVFRHVESSGKGKIPIRRSMAI